MYEFRKYGPVVISAGLFVTGVGLWLFRGGVRGELQAEAVAGLWERANVVRCYGTSAPSPFVAGFVGLYGTNYVTNLYSDVTIELHSESNGEGHTLWSTNTLRFTERDQEIAADFVLGPGAATNYVSRWIVSKDGVPQNGAGTYLTISRSGSSSQVLVMDGPDVYFYYRNYFRPTGVVGVVRFTLKTEPAQIASVTTNIVATGSLAADDYMRWSPVQAMLDGYRRAAMDESGGQGRLFWTPRRCEEWTNGIVLAVEPQAWSNWHTAVSYLFHAPQEEDEEHTNRYWTTVATGEPAIDGTPAASARWPYAGVSLQAGYTLTNTPVWSAVMPLVGGASTGVLSEEEIARGAWWSNAGLGTQCNVYAHERAVTNTPWPAWTIVQKWVSSNLYLQARSVATNLHTTVWIGPPSAIEGESVTREWWASTNGFVLEAAYDPDARSGYVTGAAESPLPLTSVKTNAGMRARALHVDADARIRHTYLRYTFWDEELNGAPMPSPYCSWAWYLGRYVEATEYVGMTAPHPCEYACASGLVSRVRVFAAVRHLTGDDEFGYNALWWWSNWGGDNEWYSADARDRATAATGYGYADAACLYAERPQGEADLRQTDEYWPGNAPSVVRLQLLADVENPTTRPVWGWGTNDLSGALTWEAGRWALNDWRHGYDLTLRNYDDEIRYVEESRERVWVTRSHEHVDVLFIAVVTDWNFRHMTDGFTPTNYVPEWARTNAP